jgi:hypothetical protein
MVDEWEIGTLNWKNTFAYFYDCTKKCDLLIRQQSQAKFVKTFFHAPRPTLHNLQVRFG